jgi:hypothetical protein
MLKQTERRNISFLFWGCLLFSIAVHTLIIFAFYSKPLWIAKLQSAFRRFSPQENVVYAPENHLLDGVFDHLIIVSSEKKSRFDSPFPTFEKPVTMLDLFRNRESFDIAFSPHFYSLDENADSLLLKESSYSSAVQPVEFIISSPSMPHPQNEIAYLSVSINPFASDSRNEQSLPLASVSQEANSTLSLHFQAPNSSFLPSYGITEYEQPQIQFHVQNLERSNNGFSSLLPKSAQQQQTAFALANYKLPEWEEEANWNDLFAVDVRVMPRKEQQGLYFAVTLTPKPEASMKGLKQHFHFIVDGGARAEKYRLGSFKRALTRAISYLAEGQTFNIYFVGDRHFHSLSQNPIEVSKKSIALAKQFLESESLNDSISSKGSLYSVLNKIQQEHSEGVDTVIFITDGAFLKTRNSSQNLQNWLKSSGPSTYQLHVATVGNTPHPVLLDAMAASSGGKVLHSSTHASFPRKFAKLLIDMKTPIATDLSTHLDLKNSNLAISLLGTSCKIPPLFASQSTTFFGVANGSSSFSLKLEGWNGQSPVELSFEIDLEKARHGTMSMKQITLQDKAEYELSLFLSNGEKKHLDQAIEWLESASPQAKNRL